MSFLLAFLVGGALCMVAQIVMDVTHRTPADILVAGVVLGAVAAGFGLYEPLTKIAGAGASVPLPGFGASLVQGLTKELPQEGWVSLFSGAFKATGAGIKAALVFGLIASWLVRSRA